jgi:hypothetical protein
MQENCELKARLHKVSKTLSLRICQGLYFTTKIPVTEDARQECGSRPAPCKKA